MEKKEIDKRNSFYIKIMAVFLLIVLFLTFFSKSVYNYNLPEVSVEMPMQGELKHDLEGSGTVSYKNVKNIYPESEGRVKEIRGSSGVQVNEGDVLLVLKAENEGGNIEIKAPKSGIVLTVCVQEGMYVSAAQNEPLLQIAEPDNFWKTELLLDEDAAASLEKGTAVSLEIAGVLGEISGTVESLESEIDNGITVYKAVIEFTCDNGTIAGKRTDISIRRSGEVFETILPAYAVHKDQKGYFVWTIKEESNILGNHYVVNRMSVDLQDTDEYAAAVVGIFSTTPIVTSCTEELKDGVRVAYDGSGE